MPECYVRMLLSQMEDTMTKRVLIIENKGNCPYQQYISELGGFICSRILNEKRRIVCCFQEDDFPEECPLDKL